MLACIAWIGLQGFEGVGHGNLRITKRPPAEQENCSKPAAHVSTTQLLIPVYQERCVRKNEERVASPLRTNALIRFFVLSLQKINSAYIDSSNYWCVVFGMGFGKE